MLENLDADLLYFVYKQCPPNWFLPEQTLPFYDLTFILSGEAVYYINETAFHLCEGDAIYIPKGNLRKAETSPDKPLFCVAFNFKLKGCEGLDIKTKFSWHNDETLKMYFNELNMEWLQKKPEYKLKAKALFMLIIHRLVTFQNSSNIQVERIKKIILKNYTNKLSVFTIALELNISSVYCGAIFKKQTGITINQFISQIRINKALSLLSLGDISVTDACYQSGFDDLYYFSKTFKNIVGIPPSSYRKLHQ